MASLKTQYIKQLGALEMEYVGPVFDCRCLSKLFCTHRCQAPAELTLIGVCNRKGTFSLFSFFPPLSMGGCKMCASYSVVISILVKNHLHRTNESAHRSTNYEENGGGSLPAQESDMVSYLPTEVPYVEYILYGFLAEARLHTSRGP